MNKFAIIEIIEKNIISVCEVRTIEEAYHMLKKWMDYKPQSNFEIMEIS